MGTSWVAVSINNITTRASRKMTSRKKYQHFRFYWGERCQALACGGARYLPSLIALFYNAVTRFQGGSDGNYYLSGLGMCSGDKIM